MSDLVQPSELQILILALALTPVMAWAYRGMDVPRRGWLAAALTAMIGGYVATVVEGFLAADLFNTLEHFMYAVASGCFAVFATGLLRRCKSLTECDHS